MRARLAFVAVAVMLALARPSPCRAGSASFLRIRNARTGETIAVRFGDQGRLRPVDWARLGRVFGARDGRRRAIHPRLLRTLAHIQRHFGAARIELLSGYRTRDTWQWDSYHQVGRAADIQIRGVPNRALFEYCLTLQDRGALLGCGYYPQGRHVHIDVRGQRALWVDLSSSSRRPRYAARPRAWLGRHR